jgi:TolB-like protein/Tfp pilus assembly protein PilF/tRNA A-37 threonylcarbamoyl transferase component Bud32
MNLQGLSDSVAGVTEAVAKCSQCGTSTRLGNGLCLSCTLREGLQDEREPSRDSFEAVLAEDDVSDIHWRVANYEILEEIGRGGMGVIYRARQRHSRRIVALKRMVSYHADSRETRERFRREAEAAASLDHPNILPIYDVGQGEDGLPFFSMKYAAGGSLQKAGPALRKNPRECVRLMAKVARAVQYAHEHGILHRDLKPGNVLLDGRGEPFVTDFGLAKWLDTSTDLTRTLTIFGTPGYIAPEQAKGSAAKLTPAADVYSLGAILFDLFTGRPPFLGEHALAVIQQASEKPAPKLRSIAPTLDRDLETICARCLEREPDARYHTAGALAEDLERWLEDRPISARPVRAPARVWRWSRRNPILAGAIAGCLLLAFAVVGLLEEKFFARKITAPEKSIAVLPFENLSRDPDNAFFTNGVQDEILTALARLAHLKVISRTSVMEYKSGIVRDLGEIGQQLGVAHVLEGSVQRSGNRVRVNAQLVDTRTDDRLWAQSYDRDLADVFAIQSDIAKAIANELQVKLSVSEQRAIAQPPTTDLTAFLLYNRAKSLLVLTTVSAGVERTLEAIELLNQAVARDPSFFLAYCQLAYSHDQLYSWNYDHTSARLALAEAAVAAALRLRPNAGEAHLARGENLFRGHRDYDGALAELDIARRTLPNDARIFEWTGLIQWRQGKPEESVRNLERALQLDPRNLLIAHRVALRKRFLRRYAEALAVLDRCLAINPNDIDTRILRGGFNFEWKGDPRPLHQVIDAVRAENPDAVAKVADNWFRYALAERDANAAEAALEALGKNTFGNDAVQFTRAFCEGLIARMTNDEIKARSAFSVARAEQEKRAQAQPDYGPTICVLGLIDAGLGRKEEALREGRRAIELLPVEKDFIDGVQMIQYFAWIAAWVGEKDLACEQLAIAARLPGYISYGELKLQPWWDPLRGDPCFEKIVASLAPK